jgi:hypothetical protein
MHVIVPYAFGPVEPCTEALSRCELPLLRRLLDQWCAQPADGGDAYSLSTPHERAQARSLGLPTTDGQIPWAALAASQHPELRGQAAGWAFISLCHWQVHSHHIAMTQWPMDAISQADDEALRTAMQPYFSEDGITLYPDQPGRWLAQGDVLADLATASAERVVGRDIKPWMPGSEQARPLRRLQNEMQMLLYTHPVNDARITAGLRTINSFWLHGTGNLPPAFSADGSTTVRVCEELRPSALAQNWAGWIQAWQALDAGPLRDLHQAWQNGQNVQLTLCGERQAQIWQPMPQTTWQARWHALRQRFVRPNIAASLKHL